MTVGTPVYTVSHPCGKLITQDVAQVSQFIDTFREGTGITLRTFVDEKVFGEDETPFYMDPAEREDW